MWNQKYLGVGIVVVSLVVVVAAGACSDDAEEEQQQDDEHVIDAEGIELLDDPDRCETGENEPAGLMLTWQQDPTTTITIDWHSHDEQPRDTLCFREADDEQWTYLAESAGFDVPHLSRQGFRTELADLQPDTEYVFQVGEFDEEYRFRTMPEDIDEEPVVFATGGDTMHAPEMFEDVNEAAMQYELDFIAWGGDLAYADGGTDPFHDERWRWWFESLLDTLIYDDGRVVPIIAGIGNHEIAEGYYFEHDDFQPTDQWREENAPYYFSLFAFPGQPGYDVLDFGDYMSLIVLDSDHANPVEGEQTQWLESVIAERHEAGVDHIFPLYHVAAFPSDRSLDGDIQTRIRDHWVPLFEQNGVEWVFEKHDHTYKRTHPIREGEVDEEEGIIYIGDGAWGVITRSGDSADEWYIDRFESIRHAIIVTLKGDQRHAEVVSERKEIIDEVGEPL